MMLADGRWNHSRGGEVYRSEEYNVIFENSLPEHSTLDMPNWWRPGMSLVKSVEDFKVVGVTEAVVGDESGAEANEESERKRRKKVHVKQEAIDWECKCTLEEAKQLNPDVFASVHKDAPRRWVHSKDKPDEVKKNLAVHPYLLMGKRSKTAGSEHRVSRSYVKSLVKGLGLSYRNNVKRGEVEIEKSVAMGLSMNLVRKVVYLISLHSISKDRVFNLDETSTKLLPYAEYGYVEKNSPETRLSDSRVQVTVTPA
eukprot:1804722-Amphidinium_carterae.1